MAFTAPSILVLFLIPLAEVFVLAIGREWSCAGRQNTTYSNSLIPRFAPPQLNTSPA